MLPEPLRTYADVVRAQFTASLAVQFQYRAAQVIWLLFFVLQPVLYLSIWSTVARSSSGQVGGYEPRALAGYFLCSMWLIHLTFNGVLVFFEARVRRGDFSPLLLRPIHPIVADIGDNLAYKALTLPLLGVATVGLVIAFRPLVDPPPRTGSSATVAPREVAYRQAGAARAIAPGTQNGRHPTFDGSQPAV